MLWRCALESSLVVLVLCEAIKKEIKKDSEKKTCLSLWVQFVNNMKRSEKVESTYCTKCFIVLES